MSVKRVALVLALLAFAITSLKNGEYPYVGVFTAFALIALIIVAATRQTELVCSVWIVIATITGTAAIVELVWTAEESTYEELHFEGEGYPPRSINDIFGYLPDPNTTTRVRKYNRDVLIYEAVYRIGDHGFRKTPQKVINSHNDCIWIFGGSFSFGEGIDDKQTISARMALHLNEKYSLYNYGIHGWGPHQMLAGLESGYFARAGVCQRVEEGIYFAISDHVRRASGLDLWDWHGPRYVPNTEGGVSNIGHFENRPYAISFREKVINYLEKSIIYSRIFGKRRAVRKVDIELYAKVVKQAEKVFKKGHPESRFRVLYWDLDNESYRESAIKALEEYGIEVIRVSGILSNHEGEKEKYVFPVDGHPTAYSQDLLARALSGLVQ